ncbi:Polysaccharide deacetylase [Roseovarius litorisediminis]|uniref:Chitooligosaccharide deacetylase n=2 Tax=Roseovarius litorisediminis TaxID=1312363 RepID=A0A1Y5TNI5_9RHOB|nr:Polysaccharide deacetylase [Roseovarius litorisediminis]
MGIVNKIKHKARQKWLARQSLERLQEILSQRRGVLSLCYHALSPELNGYDYRTQPAAFDTHLAFLKEVFDLVPASAAVSALRDGTITQKNRPVAVLCFDDGYRDNLTKATGILEKHDVPAILFAARDLIKKNTRTHMSEDELKILAAHPLWELGAHAVTHNVLTGYLADDQLQELTECRDWLSDLTGKTPKGFAYPQGQLNEGLVALVRDVYEHAFATDNRASRKFDIHQIRRHCPTSAEDDIKTFACALIEAPFENGLV